MSNRAKQKLKEQLCRFASDCPFQNVEEVGAQKAELEKRKKRLDFIVENKITKGYEFGKINNQIVCVRCIEADGMIMLDNWDRIDPLDLVD